MKLAPLSKWLNCHCCTGSGTYGMKLPACTNRRCGPTVYTMANDTKSVCKDGQRQTTYPSSVTRHAPRRQNCNNQRSGHDPMNGLATRTRRQTERQFYSEDGFKHQFLEWCISTRKWRQSDRSATANRKHLHTETTRGRQWVVKALWSGNSSVLWVLPGNPTAILFI